VIHKGSESGCHDKRDTRRRATITQPQANSEASSTSDPEWEFVTYPGRVDAAEQTIAPFTVFKLVNAAPLCTTYAAMHHLLFN
jgi:hypothetical protein